MVAVLHDKVEGEAENIKVENIVRRAGATYNKPEPIKSRGGQVLVLGQVLIVKFPFSGSHTSNLPTRSEFRYTRGRGPSAPHLFRITDPPQAPPHSLSSSSTWSKSRSSTSTTRPTRPPHPPALTRPTPSPPSPQRPPSQTSPFMTVSPPSSTSCPPPPDSPSPGPSQRRPPS